MTALSHSIRIYTSDTHDQFRGTLNDVGVHVYVCVCVCVCVSCAHPMCIECDLPEVL